MPSLADERSWPPETLAKYPHMAPLDKEVWERFLAKYGKEYQRMYYDVKVGKGVEPDPEWMPSIQRDAKVLSRFRIDVIAEKTDTYEVIEVKPRPSMGIIGQIIGYTKLFIQDYSPTKPVSPVVVCEQIADEIRELLIEQGATVYTV